MIPNFIIATVIFSNVPLSILVMAFITSLNHLGNTDINPNQRYATPKLVNFLEVRRTKERHKIRPNTNSSYTIWYFNSFSQITQTIIAFQILLDFVNSLIDLAWNLGTKYDKIGLGLLAGMITVDTLIVPICHVSFLLCCCSNQCRRRIMTTAEWSSKSTILEIILFLKSHAIRSKEKRNSNNLPC